MKINRAFLLSFMAPLMIFISMTGLAFRQDNKKIFYVPIGLMGIFIILEKYIGRKVNRKRMLEKIKTYQKLK